MHIVYLKKDLTAIKDIIKIENIFLLSSFLMALTIFSDFFSECAVFTFF